MSATPHADPGTGTLVYLATEDWYFCLHRLPMARAARDAGWRVVVATRVARHGAAIEAEGFRLIPLPWRRGGGPGSVGRELAAFARFWRLLRRERPRLVHGIALKSLVYAGIAARLAGVPARVGTVAGLGHVFSSGSFKARLLRPALSVALRLATGGRGSVVTLENPDDGARLARLGAVARPRMVLVRGSGVDLERFSPGPAASLYATEVPVIAMACRLLRAKGAAVAVAAIRRLRLRGIACRFRLAGAIDPDSADSHRLDEIEAWVAEGLVEYLGWIDDVPEFWRGCDIALYPSSYGEGVPRCSIEAIACGRPLVTTDLPGCRETVTAGVNGYLVPPNDPEAVADRLGRLLADPDLRLRMGTASRAKAVAEFGDARFVAETLAVYARAVGGG